MSGRLSVDHINTSTPRNALGNTRWSVRLVVLLYGISASSCGSHLQTGSIEGHVSGASDISMGTSGPAASQVPTVPNVNVTVKNTSTGAVQTARADFAGNFRIENLGPGRYEVFFAATPFNPQQHAANVRPGETVDASTRLLIGHDADDFVDISGCPARPVGGVPPPDIGTLEIQLKRTPYTVHLFGDGRVEYRGDRNVSTGGVRKYRVDPSAVNEIAKKFHEKGFFNFCTSYRLRATDQATYETTIHFGNITKTVSVYGGKAPEGLGELQNQIEQTAHVAQFVESRDSHPRIR
jgi:Carboxypeptidase regulatory-like domain/Domain of unknown function (DUF6438)